jgi:hypothetical protein
MAHDPHHLAPEVLAFLAERHLATLTTLRPDGTPHVVAVGSCATASLPTTPARVVIEIALDRAVGPS